ncbi:MAG: ChbG/HpnK family deacetylase [Hyphomicrobiales bacterium]|nr:ChbG/HpnK family deacetylase [Hyphomicrobiales bacterium]MBV9053369.1 ChbG/HpnK family deacetylase [Hyphomicrobiales bacterium]
MLRFVLCADDFALSEGVSRSILALLREGRVTATSAMTNRENWPIAAPRLREFVGKADLGVHLNLTCGNSLGVMSRFAPTGAMPRFGRVLWAALSGRLPLAEIADEFRRQIDAYAAAMGREPDFLDGHQHVHAFPGVRDALFTALEGLGLARRLYVRDPADRVGAIARRRLCVGKAMVIATLARQFGKELRARSIAANTSFAGVVPFDPRRDYGADFARFLVEPGERHLVMCHPGEIDEELERADPVSATRPQEALFLGSSAFLEVLAKLDAAPARFRDFKNG